MHTDRGTHLERAYLNGAHIEKADLSRARLEKVYLSEAHLEQANLSEAHLEEGYGYRPGRSLIAYLVVIFGFMGLYLLNAHGAAPHLSWDEALVLSVSSFTGVASSSRV